MKELFKTDFGNKLKDFSQKTHLIVKESIVYKIKKDFGHPDLKKGFHYYIDKTHFDHIEVYDKRGFARTVLNLDGTVNYIKAKNAMGRTIKV
ncbi:MAG: hemagglutinin [Candidatus Dependentiae bacterium]